jgi:hypothetical protein
MTKPVLPLTTISLSVLKVDASTSAPAQGRRPERARRRAARHAEPRPAGGRLEASCAASAAERASRHPQSLLFQRLRGEQGIRHVAWPAEVATSLLRAAQELAREVVGVSGCEGPGE